jgi:hypothetical protein
MDYASIQLTKLSVDDEYEKTRLLLIKVEAAGRPSAADDCRWHMDQLEKILKLTNPCAYCYCMYPCGR